MKVSKLSDTQKAFIWKLGGDKVPIAEICRQARISQATDSIWEKKYSGDLQQSSRKHYEYYL